VSANILRTKTNQVTSKISCFATMRYGHQLSAILDPMHLWAPELWK